MRNTKTAKGMALFHAGWQFHNSPSPSGRGAGVQDGWQFTAPRRQFGTAPGKWSPTLLLLAILAAMNFSRLGLGRLGRCLRASPPGSGRLSRRRFQGCGRRFRRGRSVVAQRTAHRLRPGLRHAAAGENEKAIEQFRTSAMAPDHKLAAASHYNLGCLDIAAAKAKFGEHPENAGPDVRKEGIETLLRAVAHFRDCLRIDAEHADARYNLETIRLWIKHMQEVWKHRDRQQRRQEMKLLQFLQMLEQRAAGVAHDRSRAGRDAPDSPRQREAHARGRNRTEIAGRGDRNAQAEDSKRTGRSPAATGGSPPGPTAANADAQKAVQMLNGMADEIHGTMTKAADELAAGKVTEAIQSQTAAVEQLDRVFMAVAPFVNLVQKAIAAQEGLVELSKEGDLSTKDTKDTKEEKDAKDAKDKQREKRRKGREEGG